MNLDLSDEQAAFRDVVRGFAEEVVAPQAADADREERFPLEVVRRMGELGLFGLPFPERYGGSEAGAVTMCLAIEEIGRADQSAGITLSAAVGLAGTMIDRFGTEEQKERWLAPLARGKTLGSFALTEPGGGSDAAAARTTARLDDDAWVIDGAKAFITNAGTPITAFHVVAAATEPGGGPGGLSTIVVPADAPGVSVGAPYRKIGWHASDTRGVAFDGCRVPADALLGERGRGFPQCLEILTDARIGVAALAVGLAQACLDAAVAYAGEREAFGRPIGANQAIQTKVADMRVAVETARLATYRAAWLKDEGRPHVAEASIAKLAASEAAVRCAGEAVQIHGAYGFSEESPVARYYRDAKVLEIGEGTSEIHRLILARDLGLPSAF
ncbi:MAG TPA: acyl-CoA dehydrogenase family protein [Actinomycetota bacterium]|jgi:alkylation response protein AidB-like acyl-CoA dehydrogenase